MTLLTAASAEFWPIMERTAPNKLAYCLRWELSLAVRRHYRMRQTDAWGEREQFMLDALPQCDWLWFMGADTLIMNQAIDVRGLVDPAADLIIGRDVLGINNDVMLLRSCEATADFLRQVMRCNDRYPNDQAAMADKLHLLRARVVPQRLFNSYLYAEYPYHTSDGGGTYQPGDFVLHLPGLGSERRLELLAEYLPKVAC